MFVKVKKAAKNDFNAVAGLWRQLAGFHAIARPDLYSQNVDVMSRSRFDRILADPDQQIFIIKDKNKAYGAIHMTFTSFAANSSSAIPAEGEIKAIVVDEKHRAQGLAQQLIKKGEEWAASKGATYVILHTMAFNRPAQKSYKAAGYKIESHCMGKFLKPAKPGTPDV